MFLTVLRYPLNRIIHVTVENIICVEIHTDEISVNPKRLIENILPVWILVLMKAFFTGG